MKMKSLDLSGKIDQETIDICELVNKVAKQLNIKFFLIGALARDLIMIHGYNIDTLRATLDLDLGLLVNSWEEYELLRNELLSDGKFIEGDQVQRLIFLPDSLVDIVPFGGVNRGASKYTWPPKHNIEMGVIGFKEALENSITITLRSIPKLDIQCASIAGIAMMKIISWNENQDTRKKDAEDLGLILRNQIYMIDGDEIAGMVEDYMALTEDYDDDGAAVFYLGKEMSSLVEPETKSKLIEILERETNQDITDKLVISMISMGFYEGENYENNHTLLINLLRGLKA